MKLLLSLACSLGLMAQAVINPPAITLDATGSAAVLAWMAGQGTGTITTITAPVAPGDTTITVDVATGIPVNAVISLGTGHNLVTAKTGKVLTVTRGYNGTTPGSHAVGAVVTEMKYKTLNALGKNIVVDRLRQIVDASPTVNAPITAAGATKDATVTGSVQ